MKNKKVTINELSIIVRYEVLFTGEVSEKVARQLQAVHEEEMVYSEEDDPIDKHPYKEALELVADVGYRGVPSRYTYEIDSLEFSEKADEEE